MSNLTEAHRGYEYQDLLIAGRFVDLILGKLMKVYVDEKLVLDDRFDDLTTVDIAGYRERTQFKHTENDDRPLDLRTFTADSRGLRLDKLFSAVLADRAGPGNDASGQIFRVVLRDQAPRDPSLTVFLRSLERDPGPFLPSMQTVRLGFDAEALWGQRKPGPKCTTGQPFSFLFRAKVPPSLDELRWICEHLVVEVGAPPASGDLTAPDQAEHLLLARVRSEVGAEAFPNVERTAVDVAAAMVSTARAARQGRLVVTAQELLRRAQLRSDFGAVARAHPVDRALEVPRPATVHQLAEAATEYTSAGGHLLVVGPPGHGKSWVCQQLLETLSDQSWLIAEHYCYLGDADGERLERVLAEAVFGSLIGRLAEADPRLVMEHRPRFAADEEALIGCLRRSLEYEPNRRIALIIDGIDHITRVRVRKGDLFDPSRSLAKVLSALDLPPGTVLVILSQPGSHLDPLEEVGAKVVRISGLSEYEIESLAARLAVISRPSHDPSSSETPLLEDTEVIGEFLEVLTLRSAGNALYATYLCRETLRLVDTHVDPVAAIRNLPAFDGTLKNYYDHLYQTLGAEAGWVADVVALVDFSVTRAELREIRPEAAHRVDRALSVLEPVLIELATQGGIRVYHESFARYLRRPYEGATDALAAQLERIADWLAAKGLFNDPRAFRSLLTILSEAGHDERVVDLVDQMFVTRAVAAGFASSRICANLGTAIGSAARLGRWPMVVRYVELARAAESYQDERFDSTLVAFADVPAALLGADTLAARLVDDDRIVMPARSGLQMCAAVDALGATAPWQLYMAAFLREEEADNTSYGEASDRAVALAWLRGRLRLATDQPELDPGARSDPSKAKLQANGGGEDSEKSWDPTAPVPWSRLAEWIETRNLSPSKVVRALLDTQGLSGAIRLIHSLQEPGAYCLELAEIRASELGTNPEFLSPRMWAIAAAAHSTPVGSIHRLLRLGLAPTYLVNESILCSRERLLDLTRRIQDSKSHWDYGHVAAWLDACALAAHRDPLGLDAAEAIVVGVGWYRCWLRFVLVLTRAEAALPEDRGSLALEGLHLLTDDLDPFSGDPRSCDLYNIDGAIHQTIRRAMRLLDHEQWELALGILKKVSDSITTTLSGGLFGPIPPDFVLRIAVDGASPNRRRVAESLVEDEIVNGSANRYYTDLAEYRLLATRLALATEDRQKAETLWLETCSFLTAYRFRKDITIYEVLDPLPNLIKNDPARARARVANVQGLCERVPLHTDKRATRHAWSRWWRLLAKADPVAMVHLVVPQLLANCNYPNWLLDGALEDLWEEWHEQADPILSGALRLVLDTTLHSADVQQLKLLADELSVDGDTVQRLIIWLLARVDERPVTYKYTNSDELIAIDNKKVAALNEFAETANLPPILSIGTDDLRVSESHEARDSQFKPVSPRTTEYASKCLVFPRGVLGLTRAIRAWRSRPYDTQAPEWAAGRFVNIIGYRLMELAVGGRYQEAASALRSLADGSNLGGRAAILRSIAQGLKRHGEDHLAAIAYSLTWTQANGDGGWLTFGGETEIQALAQATALGPEIACKVVGEEVERIVTTSRSGPYGISRALIYAFSVGALKTPDQPSVDVAFAAWDEAFAIIEARAPRVDPSDDPDQLYLPPNPDSGEAVPGNFESALALAALGGLAHPGREKKRRAFLAVQILLDNRAAVAAPAFNIALGTISDPATATRLLHLIESAKDDDSPVLEECQGTLRDLASRRLITVRALARRLLGDAEPPLPPPSTAVDALIGGSGKVLWTPDHGDTVDRQEPPGLDGLLDSVASERLRRAEWLLPGLRSAVRERAAELLRDEKLRKRLESQLDVLADRTGKRWPDAFLAHEQTIEEILQEIATGGRAARLMNGEPIWNPIAWEDELASTLLDDPTIPLSLEAHRQPRPRLSPPPGYGHKIWAQIVEHLAERAQLEQRSSSPFIEDASEEEDHLLVTLSVESAVLAPIVEGGPFEGWRWLATIERRSVKHPDWNRKELILIAERYRVLEVRDLGDRKHLKLPPVTSGDLRMWGTGVDPTLEGLPLDNSQPLVGMDRELIVVGDGHSGLGVPESLPTPTAPLLALLGLKPGTPFSSEDDEGVGLALVTWRAEYDKSDHYLAWPRLCGAGIVIRPDLFKRLLAIVGEQRLILRDFIVGSRELLVD